MWIILFYFLVSLLILFTGYQLGVKTSKYNSQCLCSPYTSLYYSCELNVLSTSLFLYLRKKIPSSLLTLVSFVWYYYIFGSHLMIFVHSFTMKNFNFFFLLSGYSRSCKLQSLYQCLMLILFFFQTMCGPYNTHFLYHHSWLMLFLPCILSLHEVGRKHVYVCRGFISSCNFSPPETCLSVCHITLDCILNIAFKKPLLIITWGLWMILLSFGEDFWFGRDIVCYYWKSP